jgi:LysM repeat protein
MSSTFPISAADCGPSFGTLTVRLGNERPDHAVYVRRRLVVGLIIVGLCAMFGVTARNILTDRGSEPASTPAIRLATLSPAADTPPVSVAAAVATQYIVQPGDTLWSLAELFHGTKSVGSYVDALVDRNGGASLQAGQLLTLP